MSICSPQNRGTRLAGLTGEDRRAFEGLWQRRRNCAPREEVVREGDNPGNLALILSGWACKTKQLEDGRQQIVGYLLPGDLTDTVFSPSCRSDHTVSALTALGCAEIPHAALLALGDERPAVRRALGWEVTLILAMQREWILNIGQRSGPERVGHLLCELYMRLRRIGLTRGDGFHLPVAQSDLASSLGLSVVHLNRKLMELRDCGLVELKGHYLRIPDLAALQAASYFDPDYLYLNELDCSGEAAPDLALAGAGRAAPERLYNAVPQTSCNRLAERAKVIDLTPPLPAAGETLCRAGHTVPDLVFKRVCASEESPCRWT